MKKNRPVVGWNDDSRFNKPVNPTQEEREARLKEISDIPPDDYAQSVIGGISNRIRSKKLGRDATYDEF